MRSYVFLLLLTACGIRSCPNAQELSPTKQKQKIVLLQKKLQLVGKEQDRVHTQIEKLNGELETVQLTYIRNKVDDYEELLRKDPRKRFYFDSADLFAEERETLHQMIQSGHAIFEAQVVLDRILQLITELGDSWSR